MKVIVVVKTILDKYCNIDGVEIVKTIENTDEKVAKERERINEWCNQLSMTYVGENRLGDGMTYLDADGDRFFFKFKKMEIE